MSKFWKPTKSVLESLEFYKVGVNWWKAKDPDNYGGYNIFTIMWQKDFDGEYILTLKENNSEKFVGAVESKSEFMILLRQVGWLNG